MSTSVIYVGELASRLDDVFCAGVAPCDMLWLALGEKLNSPAVYDDMAIVVCGQNVCVAMNGVVIVQITSVIRCDEWVIDGDYFHIVTLCACAQYETAYPAEAIDTYLDFFHKYSPFDVFIVIIVRKNVKHILDIDFSVNNIFMIWTILGCGAVFGVVAYAVARYKSENRADVVYHCERYEFFSDEIRRAKDNIFVRVYADIVCKKIYYNTPKVYSPLDRSVYDALRLERAPVYVTTKCNIYGNVAMLVQAVGILNKKINIVCKNIKKINIKNIQIYFIDENINKKNNSLINSLNINRPYIAYDSVNTGICECYYEKNKIKIIKNKNNILILPKNNYGYLLCKNKNIYSIKNIFGKEIFSLAYSGRVRLERNALTFTNTSEQVVDMDIVCDYVSDGIALVETSAIRSDDDSLANVGTLAHLARAQLRREPLECIGALYDFDYEHYGAQLARQGMKKYIMYANFAKDYFARYYHLLKYVYGVSTSGLVKPDMRYAYADFAIYVGDECVAKYENGKKILAKLKKI